MTDLLANIAASLGAGTLDAVREAGRLCSLLPEPTAATRPRINETRFSTAFSLEQHGDLDAAANLYRGIADDELADPVHRANASFRYGFVREMQGQHEESIRAYLHTLAQGRPFPAAAAIARQQLAGLLVLGNRLAEALPHLEALLTDPDWPGHHRELFWFRYLRCLLAAGKFDLSHEDVLRDLPEPGGQVDEGIVGLWTEAAYELELLPRPELAKDLYLRLLQMEGVPGAVRTNCYFRIGLMFEHLSDWDEGMRYYRQAIQAPDAFAAGQAQARYRLAELLYLMEDFEEAMQHLAVLNTAPELNRHQQLESHLRLGICLMRSGRFEEAQRELESCRARAAAHDDGFGIKADLCLAELFEKQKDLASARECYRRIIDNPGSEPLQKAGALMRLGGLRSA